MKKNLYKVLSLVLAAIMIISAASLSVSATTIVDSGDCGDNLTWTLDNNGTLTISGTGDMYNYSQPYQIETPWNDAMVKKLILEEGITSIGSYAFYECDELSGDVIIPEGVTKIADHAFYQTGIEKIVLPETLEYIGEYAFSFITVSEIFIPENVSEIGKSAFGGIYADTFRVDEDNAFFSADNQGILYNKEKTVLIQSIINKKYTQYVIPEGVETISFGAFAYSVYTESIKLPDSLKVLSELAFCYTSNLKEINLPEKLKVIKGDDVLAMTGITSIVISCDSDVPGLKDNLERLWFLEDVTLLNKQFSCSAVDLGKTIKIKEGKRDEFRSYYKTAFINFIEYELGLTDSFDYEGATFDEYIANEDNKSVNLPFVMRCYKGTSAERYAKANGMTVVYLCDHKNTEIIPAVAASCTTTGLTEGIKCADCDEIILEQTVTEKTDHSYIASVTTPTCEEGGYTAYTCACGDSYVTDYTATVEHRDADGDYYCDWCYDLLKNDTGNDNKDNCSHMCHQSGFNGFIWKIVQFFWKLFKMNPVCECGASHY